MITVKKYSGLEARESEALRYAGAQGSADEDVIALLRSCRRELSEARQGLVCFGVTDVVREGDRLFLGSLRIESEDMKKYLEGCERAVIFAATLGVLPDRLIRKYARVSPARALMIDALCSALAESLCDAFCQELGQSAATEGRETRRRVSPGYGDIPLAMQRDIFAFLGCERRIGLSLNDDLLMTPTKSVTAIVGIK